MPHVYPSPTAKHRRCPQCGFSAGHADRCDDSRYGLARRYNRQRETVSRVFAAHGWSAEHTRELDKLADIAAALHAAEAQANVSRGSTRREMGA